MPNERTPCEWAADLVERLASSGTPADKLRCVKDAMADRWEETTDLEADDPRRHLSAAEAAELLAERFGPDHGTACKARAFVTVGYLEAPKPVPHPAELIPKPPRAAAPVARAKPPVEPPKEPAGDTPGVRDLSVEVPTVGPKPVVPKAPPPPPKPPEVPKGKDKAKDKDKPGAPDGGSGGKNEGAIKPLIPAGPAGSPGAPSASPPPPPPLDDAPMG